MKQIPLTQGKFAQVDDEDYEYLMQWKWFASKKQREHTFYARRNCWINNKKTHMLMHRFIMKAEKGQFIDHEDRNGLNNQKFNLRFCNRSQNCSNIRKRKNTTSKYIGVHLTKGNTWQAQIKKNNKKIHLGYFDTERIAAIAYDKKAVELHGEFASLNFK